MLGREVLSTRPSGAFCAVLVHYSNTCCVNLYDEKHFPGIREHVLLT
jgi:hypothetical protein